MESPNPRRRDARMYFDYLDELEMQRRQRSQSGHAPDPEPDVDAFTRRCAERLAGDAALRFDLTLSEADEAWLKNMRIEVL